MDMDATCRRSCSCPCARSAPSKPRSKQKQKTKRVRAGSESEGGASGRDSSIDIDDEDGDEGKDLLHKLFEDGNELHKATGPALATGLMGTMMRVRKISALRNQWGMGVGRGSVLRLWKCVAGCGSVRS
jgi:hypothetical protein